jgi:hypothetical protein
MEHEVESSQLNQPSVPPNRMPNGESATAERRPMVAYRALST